MMQRGDGPVDKPCGAHDWVSAIRAADFAQAWEITDRDLLVVCRSGTGKHEGPRHLQRIWRGESLRGRHVLVRCYHGLGDTIQFARFLSPLSKLTREITVWCQPPLLPLIARVQGVDRVLPLHDGTPEIDFDVDIEIMEIAHAIGATRDQIETHQPYLRTQLGRRPAEACTLSVGLVWDVGDWDRRRVVPAELLKRMNISRVRLFSLQQGPASQAAAEIGARDISTPDIDVLAERLCGLDLCVCPDTMIAHLSAALGCETWVMLHADCDWRWPTSGSATFWYPTMRLFHQRVAGDWCDVLADIRLALSKKVSAFPSAGRPL
jgi:hypothetical protein